MLVEDEALIREIMAECLHDAGYDVYEAADGLEAMAALQHHAQRAFCIVVTDYHMPGGMNGSDVAMQARTALPGIPVVIASGRPDVLRASWKDEHGFRLLRKPYLPSQLVAAVSALIGPGHLHPATAHPLRDLSGR